MNNRLGSKFRIIISRLLFNGLLILTLSSPAFYSQPASAQTLAKTIVVDKVLSTVSVGFDLKTYGNYQYVCYYDTSHNMVIAQRALNSTKWKRTVLPTKIGWDSHNYITMAMDKAGYIHVSGNMHAVPLVYFRSAKPENIEKFDRLPMTGTNEDKVTYPVFFTNLSGDLCYQYRLGASGQGSTYWTRYDPQSKTWSKLLDTPLFDGEGEANAYFTGLTKGPDNFYYIVLMWRLTPNANSNYNLSCIRSKDLTHWENIKGKPLKLPLTWRDNAAIVDPVGPWNGLINMGFGISWDGQQRPYVNYHKYDRDGVSQVYLARFESGKWQVHQISHWAGYTWDIGKGGSLQLGVSVSGVKLAANKLLSVNYVHQQFGNGNWLLSEDSLKVIKQMPDKPIVAAGDVAGKEILHIMHDNTGKYYMQWKTLPPNQDKPHKPPYPQPGDLVVYESK